MVPIYSLWLPVLVSAVLVFVLSWVIHMLLPLHRGDFKQLPAEADVMDALRRFEIAPGDYVMPFAGSPENMRKPEFRERLARGPVAMMTFLPSGNPGMGRSLAMWFGYLVLVGVLVAYLSSRVLPHDVSYLRVFRIVGTATFMCHAVALLQNSIWYRRNWGTTLRSCLGGFVYALATAGAFGWLWPR